MANYEINMIFEFIKSQKGCNMLAYKDFIYKYERTMNDKIIWKCVVYSKFKSKSRAHNFQEEVVRNHLHVPVIIETNKAIISMKQLA